MAEPRVVVEQRGEIAVVTLNRPVPSNEIIERLAGALGVEAAHFLEDRLRVITDRLEAMPDLIDRLYKRLG